MKRFFNILLFLSFILFAQQRLNGQILLPAIIEDTLHLSRTDSFYYTDVQVSVKNTGMLVIEKGVEIRFDHAKGISVAGTLIVNGSLDSMVLFTSSDTSARWTNISCSNAHVKITGLHINRATRFITANYGTLELIDCLVDDTYGGIGYDCIAVHYIDNILITGCELHGNPDKNRVDAIDCDDVEGAEVSFNKIMDFEDDGTDFGINSQNIIVKYNFISNCNVGVSIGEKSTATVYKNVITKCDVGIQSHTDSKIVAYNNTLFSNDKGIECHHGSSSNSFGDITLTNTIISKSINKAFTIQDGAEFLVSYCISDTDSLPGDKNLFGDPMFVNIDSMNFQLKEGSPCIDAGDHSVSINYIGEYVDIGAYEYGMIDSIPRDTTQNDTILIIPDTQNQELKVNPNPANSSFEITNLPYDTYRYCIFGLDGKMILPGILENGKKTINISSLKKGIYILRVNKASGQELYFKKIIKIDL